MRGTRHPSRYMRRSGLGIPVLITATLLVGVAGAATRTGDQSRVYAHLTETRFPVSQVGKVKLIYYFKPKSMSFSHKITFPAKGFPLMTLRLDDNWWPNGGSSGPYSTTVKKLFACYPKLPCDDRVHRGTYRLDLYPSNPKGAETLYFTMY